MRWSIGGIVFSMPSASEATSGQKTLPGAWATRGPVSSINSGLGPHGSSSPGFFHVRFLNSPNPGVSWRPEVQGIVARLCRLERSAIQQVWKPALRRAPGPMKVPWTNSAPPGLVKSFMGLPRAGALGCLISPPWGWGKCHFGGRTGNQGGSRIPLLWPRSYGRPIGFALASRT
jgi:hypothetical protein